MPGLTGPDLVDELRRRGVQTPVIFVSGHAEHALIERVRGAPNALLLAKPFTTDDILARLDELSPLPAPAAARAPVRAKTPSSPGETRH
jgi:FixJ family two-component response regulator